MVISIKIVKSILFNFLKRDVLRNGSLDHSLENSAFLLEVSYQDSWKSFTGNYVAKFFPQFQFFTFGMYRKRSR